MADLKVRNLDDQVTNLLRACAKANGVSLEEEVRRTLTASVEADREELASSAKALHAAAGGKPGKAELDSVRTIRDERDASGSAALLSNCGWKSDGRHQST